MPDYDRRELIYTRSYCIISIIFSLISVILLFASNFAWWIDGTITYVRLSSTFRLSILVIVPLVFGFLSIGVIAGLLLFTDKLRSEKWNKIVFWISIGIFGFTIIAAGSLLIAFSNVSSSWSYGASFIGSLIGSIVIGLVSLLYFKIYQEIHL